MTFSEFRFELDCLGLIHLRCTSNGHRRAAEYIVAWMRGLTIRYPQFWQLYQVIEAIEAQGGAV